MAELSLTKVVPQIVSGSEENSACNSLSVYTDQVIVFQVFFSKALKTPYPS